jgi:hypothetical protein
MKIQHYLKEMETRTGCGREAFSAPLPHGKRRKLFPPSELCSHISRATCPDCLRALAVLPPPSGTFARRRIEELGIGGEG